MKHIKKYHISIGKFLRIMGKGLSKVSVLYGCFPEKHRFLGKFCNEIIQLKHVNVHIGVNTLNKSSVNIPYNEVFRNSYKYLSLNSSVRL